MKVKSSGPQPNKKRNQSAANNNAAFDNGRFYTPNDAILELAKLYEELQNKKIQQDISAFLEAMNNMHRTGAHIHKDEKSLHALYESYAKLGAPTDAGENRWSFHAENGATLNIHHGKINYVRAVEKTVGKAKRPVYKPFGPQDALNIALAAMYDRSLLPPNRVNISNANPYERALLERAFAYVSKNFLPENERFKIDKPQVASTFVKAAISPDFDRYMYHMKDHLTPENDNISKSSKGKKKDAPQEEVKETSYEDKLVASYIAAKDLLLFNGSDYVNASLLVLEKDISQLVSPGSKDTYLQDAQYIIKQLKADGILQTSLVKGEETITAVNFHANNPYEAPAEEEKQPEVGVYIKRVYDKTAYAQAAVSITKNPEKFLDKNKDEVLKELGLDPSDKKSKALWDQLVEDTIIVTEQVTSTDQANTNEQTAKVSGILSSLHGTRIGTEIEAEKNKKAFNKKAEAAIKDAQPPLFERKDYAKVAHDIIENPDNWSKKRLSDVAAFLGKDAKGKDVKQIVERLKRSGLVVMHNGQIVDTASAKLKGTKIAEYIREDSLEIDPAQQVADDNKDGSEAKQKIDLKGMAKSAFAHSARGALKVSKLGLAATSKGAVFAGKKGLELGKIGAAKGFAMASNAIKENIARRQHNQTNTASATAATVYGPVMPSDNVAP
jgi:hypothetical protein